MLNLIKFNEALENTKNTKKKLLLGNGFSISQTKGAFSYDNLFENSDIKNDDNLYRLFNDLKTKDFETVIRYLEDASVVSKAYGRHDEAEQYMREAERVRQCLIKAIRNVHPESLGDIPIKEIDNCGSYIKIFESIFTANYDLLLYWVSISMGNEDGFGLGENESGFRGPFKIKARCNIFNVHGGLHLFLNSNRDVEKKIYTNGINLLDEISEVIRSQKRLPLYVAEGASEQKLNKIRSVPYLNYCYQQLRESSGIIFIFGHSILGKDTHIYDAIFESRITDVYYCIYNRADISKTKEEFAKYKERNKEIKVHYIDVSDFNIWDSMLGSPVNQSSLYGYAHEFEAI